nr:hypothetical protein GCM10025730_15110 [Promicromonospora thailandica]
MAAPALARRLRPALRGVRRPHRRRAGAPRGGHARPAERRARLAHAGRHDVRGRGGSAPLAWDRLADDEREIVRLALGGATNAQIASAAYLSVRSVANRLRAIYLLLGLRDRRDLVERAQVDPPGWLAGSA